MFSSRCLTFLVLLFAANFASAATPYWVRIVDADTHRGVPLVQLSTGEPTKYYWTDSNGIAVIQDAALQGRDVPFNIHSDGYVFEQEVLGEPGMTLHVQAGNHDELKITRLDIAERLFRMTGADIYSDTVLAGLKTPIVHPLLDAGVTGQDTNIATLFKGKIFWCWGDTDGEPRSDGKKQFNGKTTCATSKLPGKGGLDPSIGVNFDYFTKPDGFVRGMVPIQKPGLVWIEGLFTAKDEQGSERLLATYTRQQQGDPRVVVECGIVEFNESKGEFEVIAQRPLRHHYSSHPYYAKVNGKRYLYLFPVQRIPADWKSILDANTWESYTCLRPGAKLDMENPQLEHDASGKLVCGWKRNAEWIDPSDESKLVERGLIDKGDGNFPLVDVDTGKPTNARIGSVSWNPYRKKWIMIAKDGGAVYYSEADNPRGPWLTAKQILTLAPYRFYNPLDLPFLAQDGGRIIYLEGTFTAKLSGAKVEVPSYNYNNIMYKLDLSDPRFQAARLK